MCHDSDCRLHIYRNSSRSLDRRRGARPAPMPGVLRMTGEDALDLVDRLSTNEVVERPAGSGVGTVLTTNKGRVVDLLTILYMSDHWLVLTSPENQQRVIDWIEEFTFGEEIELEDVTEERGFITVVGPRAEDKVREVSGEDVSELSAYHCVEATIAGVEVIAYRGGMGMEGALNVIAPSGGVGSHKLSVGRVGGGGDGCRDIRSVPRRGGGAGFRHGIGGRSEPTGSGAMGGSELHEGLLRRQEVVARLNTYEKVKRYLSMLSFEDGAAPEPGASLTVDGKEAGMITSVAPVAVSGRRAALGYVRKKYAEPGATLTVETGNDPTVCEFVERVGRRRRASGSGGRRS